LAHVANRHIHKRVIELLKNFLSIIFGLGFLMITVIGLSFVILGEEVSLYTSSTATITLIASFIWFSLNYALFFDSIRSHEYEADAYAVINLGAAFNSIESALRKLSSHDEMPEFLKAKTSNKKKGLLSQFISRYYSTHPQLEERISSLKFKLEHNLPFNYYISPTQKLRRFIGNILNWKVLAPLSTAMAIFMFINILNFKQGSKRIALIKSSPSEVITSNEEIEKSINSRPLLLGKSLMYYIVTKRDPALIDYYLDRGAKKGKSLVYISEMKDFSLFERYYTKYGHALSEDEYFLILRKTAELNFVEGYRYLVNSKRFELLNSDYKEDIARVHRMSDRSRKPASQK
jgi:hypothetical protein